jgi:hypothetical protein
MENGSEQKFAGWCRQLFDSLTDDGKWGVPRSGLIFTKRGDKLVLTQQLPWLEGMPLTKEELENYQQNDFETTKSHFAAAGIPVEKELVPL